jgi:hypothetical protein
MRALLLVATLLAVAVGCDERIPTTQPSKADVVSLSVFAAPDTSRLDPVEAVNVSVTALVADSAGVGVSGETVVFTISVGTLTGVSSSGPDGHATAGWRITVDSTVYGAQHVIASHETLRDTAWVHVLHNAVIEASVSADTLDANGSDVDTVFAAVSEHDGSPIPNLGVTFWASLGMYGGNAQTDTAGIARTYIEGQIGEVGRCTVVANALGVFDTTFIEFVAP